VLVIEALPHGSRQLRRQVRFGKEYGVAMAEILAGRFRTVTAAVDHFETGFSFFQLRGELASVHAFRHNHIGEEQVDFSIEFIPDSKGFNARPGLDHVIIMFLQYFTNQLAQDRFIFDDKDSFPAPTDLLRSPR